MLDAIIKRRSVREFKDEPIDEKDLIEIIKAGQFAPNSRGNFAEEFIIIHELDLKQKLFELTGDMLLKNAPVLIVPVTDTTKTSEPIQDLSVLTENIFIQAADLGLGTVWKNISPQMAERIRPLLDIPDNFIFINIIPVGKPVREPEPHLETDFSLKKIHQEKW